MARRAARRLCLGLLLPALLAAGCWDRVEVNDVAIVSAAAVDRVEEEGLTRLALQIVIPARAGRPGAEGGGREGDSPVYTVVTAGRTAADAARRLQLETPRRLYWAHMRVLLIGEGAARAGLHPYLEFFTRQRDMRPVTRVAVTPGEALPHLQGVRPELERLPEEGFRELQAAPWGMPVRLIDLANMLGARGLDPAVPRMELGQVPVAPGSKPLLPEVRWGGAAVFRDERMAGWLGPEETRGLLWLKGEWRSGIITAQLPGEEGEVSMEVLRARIDRTVHWEGGRPAVAVRIEVEGNLQESEIRLDLGEPRAVARVERAVAAAIRERIFAALDVLRAAGSDAAGLGELVHRQFPARWRTLAPRWREIFPEVPVSVAVNVAVRRAGLVGKPRGLEEEELKK